MGELILRPIERCDELRGLAAEPFSSTLEWKFPSGAKVKFSHLEHDKTVLEWQGAQLPLIWTTLSGNNLNGYKLVDKPLRNVTASGAGSFSFEAALMKTYHSRSLMATTASARATTWTRMPTFLVDSSISSLGARVRSADLRDANWTHAQ